MELTIGKAIDYKEFLVQCFRDKSIIPILGAGVSVGVSTPKGRVPNGAQLQEYMLNEIHKNERITEKEYQDIEKESFSAISSIYEDNEIVSSKTRAAYFKSNFYGASYSSNDTRLKLYQIGWPYIYTLNIDDVIENSTEYKTLILPQREFNDEICNEEKCLFKLHGDISEMVKYKDASKVFNSKEYAQSLKTNRAMLNKLQSDYYSVNIVFIGCSLKDEVDLMSLETIDFPQRTLTDEDELLYKRNLFFTVGEPSLSEKSRYKKYGITDVVIFEDYDSMYLLLNEAWNQAQKVHKSDLSRYSGYAHDEFKVSDSRNKDYFCMALNPINTKERKICYPYYAINRSLKEEVIKNIDKYRIQFVSSQMFSGKTYFLASLHQSIKDREVFLFESTVHLSDEALEELLERDNALALFDTDSLNQNQIRRLLQNCDTEKKNSFVIMVNAYDSETLGLISMIQHEDVRIGEKFIVYRNDLKGAFDKKEFKKINQKLPQIGIIPIKNEESIVNHLFRISEETGMQTKYSTISIPQGEVKKTALAIALASFESLSYEQIVSFEFTDIIGNIVKECAPLIEAVSTTASEKSGKHMAGIKYVLNSKYWMRSGLNKLAKDEKQILAAYRYLIERCIDFSKEDLGKKRLKYKRIIYFNTINDIFSSKHFGNRALVARIYKSLEDLLGADYQYNHQRAKCLMRNAYYIKKGKLGEYKNALNAALIAKNQVINAMDFSASPYLRISLAHIEYTQASIMASICEEEGFANSERVAQTMELCNQAIHNIYNAEDVKRDCEYYRKKKHQYGAVFFIYTIASKQIDMDPKIKKEYDSLLSHLMRV